MPAVRTEPRWLREERKAARAAELARAETARAERKAQRKLMLEIIDAGHRALAHKLRSTRKLRLDEAMARLDTAAQAARSRI
jgi:hypothetical protein